MDYIYRLWRSARLWRTTRPPLWPRTKPTATGNSCWSICVNCGRDGDDAGSSRSPWTTDSQTDGGTKPTTFGPRSRRSGGRRSSRRPTTAGPDGAGGAARPRHRCRSKCCRRRSLRSRAVGRGAFPCLRLFRVHLAVVVPSSRKDWSVSREPRANRRASLPAASRVYEMPTTIRGVSVRRN